MHPQVLHAGDLGLTFGGLTHATPVSRFDDKDACGLDLLVTVAGLTPVEAFVVHLQVLDGQLGTVHLHTVCLEPVLLVIDSALLLDDRCLVLVPSEAAGSWVSDELTLELHRLPGVLGGVDEPPCDPQAAAVAVQAAHIRGVGVLLVVFIVVVLDVRVVWWRHDHPRLRPHFFVDDGNASKHGGLGFRKGVAG